MCKLASIGRVGDVGFFLKEKGNEVQAEVTTFGRTETRTYSNWKRAEDWVEREARKVNYETDRDRY